MSLSLHIAGERLAPCFVLRAFSTHTSHLLCVYSCFCCVVCDVMAWLDASATHLLLHPTATQLAAAVHTYTHMHNAWYVMFRHVCLRVRRAIVNSGSWQSLSGLCSIVKHSRLASQMHATAIQPLSGQRECFSFLELPTTTTSTNHCTWLLQAHGSGRCDAMCDEMRDV